MSATPPSDPSPQGVTARVLRSEDFSVADAVGGRRGVVESVLPTLVFLVLFTATRALSVSGGAAVAVCAVLVIARLVQRQTTSSALGGLIGVAIGALWALRTGNGSDFFLPGLLINAGTAIVLLGSAAARWPLVGVIAGAIDPVVADWRDDRDARRTYTRATVLLGGLYLLKLAVQIPLYLAGATAALGVAKLAMGLPLFAVVLWIIWLMHRALATRIQARAAHGAAATAER